MFFGSRGRSRAHRRGVVLILILGMLALMALIGVTFATFAGQSLVNTRNFAAGVNWPGSEQLMDYALAQLINDTNNPMSAIRGHSLLRDMYGNDSVVATGRFDQFRVSGLQAVSGGGAATSGLLTGLPTGAALVFTAGPGAYSVPDATKPFNFVNLLQYTTNIPVAGIPGLYGADFTRWVVRMAAVGNFAPATYEVLEDNCSGAFHVFTLAPLDSIDSRSIGLAAANQIPVTSINSSPNIPVSTAGSNAQAPIYLSNPLLNTAFALDGRYMRAFNGSGMSAFTFAGFDASVTPPAAGFTGAGQPHNNAAFANFRTNGGLLPLATVAAFSAAAPPTTATTPALPVTTTIGDPSAFGMDEDYDACDLENWFLALQSADGSVMIPSFHRPGILTANDWANSFGSGNTAAQNAAAVMSVSKILRPRSIDNYAPSFPPDPIPDNNGKITYDVDNDGDGVSDSVWLDLGYPPLRDPRGQTFKPLFAFMVIGLNGRLPLNTAGNLQARDLQRPIYTTSGSFSAYYPQNLTDGAIWSHASHLGFSVNEINPMYALQNAPNLVYGQASGATSGTLSLYSQFDNSGYWANNAGGIGDYSANGPLGNSMNRILGNTVLTDNPVLASATVFKNPGVGVDLTQMRNLLAGTVPQDSTQNPTSALNNDANIVAVNGQNWYLPNGMIDGADTVTNGGVTRTGVAAVPGRWGESQAIPLVLDQLPPNDGNTTPYGKTITTGGGGTFVSVYPVYTNPIRAGKSAQWLSGYVYTTGGDFMDDDYDSFDLAAGEGVTAYNSGPPFTYASPGTADPATSSTGDFYDGSGSRVLPVEWIRRFVTPIDPSGNGRVTSWSDAPPTTGYDYGNGYDRYGRVMFTRYFRPAGMPKALAYDPTNLITYYTSYDPTTAANSSFQTQVADQQALNQPMAYGPVLLPQVPTGTTPTNPPYPAPVWNPNLNPAPTAPFYDLTTNIYHGWQSQAAPYPYIGTAGNTVSETGVAVAAGMPYDQVFTSAGIQYPTGYNNTTYTPPSPGTPITNVYPILDQVNSPSTMTNFVNSGQGPVLTTPPNNTAVTPNVPDTVNYLSIIPANAGTATQGPTVVGGYPTYPFLRNGVTMPSDGLNKNEADEMNLYAPNPFDMPFGPSDLEWLYRLQDVDGAQLTSRLSRLAPISFTNPADGLTRRRLFSTDSWEPISVAFAPDNPLPTTFDYLNGLYVDPSTGVSSAGAPIAAALSSSSYNSRFNPAVSASVSAINYGYGTPLYQNPQAITQYPNPLSYPVATQAGLSSLASVHGTANFASIAYPLSTAPSPPTQQLPPLPVPSVGSRDRKVNLNYPLPVSNDPAEPIRQKWIRETYQYFKSILPPQAIDTPQELAQLSQFVVNIIDFRDPDCTTTRFVNTDLIVIPATKAAISQLAFADRPVPSSGSSPQEFIHYPFDPTIYDEQMRAYHPKQGLGWADAGAGAALQTDWANAMTYPLGATFAAGPPSNTVEFLVQHGMEYNPLALNEALAYTYPTTGGTFTRLAVEVVNMLTDDGTVPIGGTPPTNSASDMTANTLDGWDFVVTDDSEGYGRPDPVTGELPLPGLLAATPYTTNTGATTQQAIIVATAGLNAPIVGGATPPPTASPAPPVNTVSFGTLNTILAMQNGPQNATSTGQSYYVFGWTLPNSTSGTPTSTTQETPAMNNSTGNDATFPTQFTMPATNTAGSTPLAAGQTMFCWLFLRRPANPFDQRPYAYREMVTVDAIRFPYTYSNGTGVKNPDGTFKVTPGTNKLYSVERYQPFRGGHLVPPLNATTNPYPVSPPPIDNSPTAYNPTAWGYSEQTSPGGTGVASMSVLYGGTKSPALAMVSHTMGAENNPTDKPWDYFPFNDRDFASPAELLLVPGCPPGLFTKQFVEDNDPFDRNPASNLLPDTVARPFMGPGSSPAVPPLTTAPAGEGAFLQNVVRSYPYLVDKFYFSAATVQPPSTLPNDWTYPNLVGGWTGDGWYKIFEFVEVPSSANGAIGTVPNGNNFDWLRQDLKPGLLNLNLIIDEEVFFGLFDDPRLSDVLNSPSLGLNPSALPPTWLPQVVTQIGVGGYPSHFVPISSVQTLNLGATVANGAPTTGGQGRGYTDFAYDPYYTGSFEKHGIRAAFADFLKLRAGGSGFLFAWGTGATGSGSYSMTSQTGVGGNWAAYLNNYYSTLTPASSPINTAGLSSLIGVARERPFRSFTAPDINDTILRPATLPPSKLTTPIATYGPATGVAALGSPYSFAAYPAVSVTNSGTTTNYYGDPISPPPAAPAPPPPPLVTNTDTVAAPWEPYVADQGIRNPFLAAPSYWQQGPKFYPQFTPFVPMRRLFQVPDANQTPDTNPGVTPHFFMSSGSAEFSLDQYNTAVANATTYPHRTNQPIYLPDLYYPPSATPAPTNSMTSNLFAAQHTVVIPGSFPSTATINHYLGIGLSSGSSTVSNGTANTYGTITGSTGPMTNTNPAVPSPPTDNRQHPYYQTEMLQKVMNLTTVRTHQFAVWITIGFFEVLQAGSPSLGVPDMLGAEIGLASGKNIRYRSFFLLDRTRATGFDPSEPGDFRDVVTYRRRIE